MTRNEMVLLARKSGLNQRGDAFIDALEDYSRRLIRVVYEEAASICDSVVAPDIYRGGVGYDVATLDCAHEIRSRKP